jgi:hypothetical protein
MVQPKYSPTEALNRIKLMMNYDSSNTLTENEQKIKSLLKEQGDDYFNSDDEIDNDIEKSVQKILTSCSSRAEAEGTLDAASIASAFNRAFEFTVGGMFGGTDDELWKEQALKMKKGNLDDLCNVSKEFEDLGFGDFAKKLVQDLDDEELAELMETFSAMAYRTKKESKLAVASTEQKNINWFKKSFPCIFDSDANLDQQVIKNTNNYVFILIKGNKGNLYQLFADGRVKTKDGKSTGKKVSCNGSKIGFIAESIQKKKTLEEQFDEDELLGGGNGSTPKPPKPPKPPKTNRYRNCTGTYTKGCKTEPTGPIGVVQGCLGGLVVDGRFWDKTQNALIAKGYTNGFTDADIPKICEKTKDQEISGESPSEIDPSNTDF